MYPLEFHHYMSLTLLPQQLQSTLGSLKLKLKVFAGTALRDLTLESLQVYHQQAKVNKRQPAGNEARLASKYTDKMTLTYDELSSQLSKLNANGLSIIRLSEPISLTDAPDAPKRSSDASADAFENPSPASLAADLAHYKARSYVLNAVCIV